MLNHKVSFRPVYRSILVSEKLPILFVILLYEWVFVHCHNELLVPLYGYLGFGLIEGEGITPYLIATIPGLFQRLRTNSPTYVIGLLAYLILYIPLVLSANTFSNTGAIFGFYELLFLCIGFVIIGAVSSHPVTRFNNGNKDYVVTPTLLVICILLVVFVLAYLIASNGLSVFKAPWLLFGSEELQSRSSAGRLAYVFGVVRYAALPLLFAFLLSKRRYISALIVLIPYVLLFNTYATKQDILMPVLLIWSYTGIFLFQKRLGIPVLYYVVVTLIFGFLSPYLVSFMGFDSASKLVVAAFQFRFVEVQVGVMHGYADFFSKNEGIYWSHISFFSGFYKYPLSLPKLIGKWYGFGNANSNFISVEGLASFGVIGLMISTVLFSMLLLLTNVILSRSNYHLANYLFTPTIVSILNIPLFTVILSGGWAFIVLALYYIQRTSYVEETRVWT